jgi:carbon storage regulator
MLVLTRKPGEQVAIGSDLTVTVVSVFGKKVRLAFTVPDDVRILRSELACWLKPQEASAVPKVGTPAGRKSVAHLKG